MSNGLQFVVRYLPIMDTCSGCHNFIRPHGERWEATVITMRSDKVLSIARVVRCSECMRLLTNISRAMQPVQQPLAPYRACEIEEDCDKDQEADSSAGEREGAKPRVYLPKADERGATAFLAKSVRVRST